MTWRDLLVVGVVICFGACATAGSSARDQPSDAPGGGSDAPAARNDAPVRPIDAGPHDGPAPPPDAFVFHDAPPPPPPDAGNPPVCSANSDCVVPDTCCFALFCVPGTAVAALCFPS